jgi:hypothetical protein
MHLLTILDESIDNILWEKVYFVRKKKTGLSGTLSVLLLVVIVTLLFSNLNIFLISQ